MIHLKYFFVGLKYFILPVSIVVLLSYALGQAAFVVLPICLLTYILGRLFSEEL